MTTNNSYPQISFGPQVLTSAEQDALEFCKHCGEVIVDEPFAHDDYFEPFCSEECFDKHADNVNEANYANICAAR